MRPVLSLSPVSPDMLKMQVLFLTNSIAATVEGNRFS